MTEDEIEKIYERTMDKLDHELMNALIAEDEYDQQVAELDKWVDEMYRELEIAPFRKALQEIVSQIDQGGGTGKVFARDACIAEARRVLGG